MVARSIRLTLLVVLCGVVLAAGATVAAATTTGAGHWTWQSPLPHGSWISDTCFITADEGWQVTGSGDVLHTIDGGVTWDSQATGENDSLTGVGFVSATEGWAVGQWGLVLHTTDGGATWDRQISGTLDTLSKVVPVDAGHAWIVGSSTVIATTDGGATWATRLSTPSFADWWGWYGVGSYYSAAAFSDAQHGCVVGVRALYRQAAESIGAVWSTSDGGATWAQTEVAGTTALSAVTSRGAAYWACGEGNAIVHSDDGATWTKVTVTAPVYLNGIAVNAAGEGWAVGYGDSNDWFSGSNMMVGIALHTADGGDTWQPVADPVLGGDDLLSVTLDDTGFGRVVGQSGGIYVTTDGGATWAAVGPERTLAVAFLAMTQSPDGRLWVVGQSGSPYGDGSGGGVLRTSADGGATWDEVADPLLGVGGLNAVYAGSGGDVWVAGVGGRILHSSDGGATWVQQPTGIGNSVLGLAFADAEHGWAISSGLRGTVLKTVDGGQHWTLTPVGTYERYFRVEASGSDVWLGGMAYNSECEEHGAGLIAHSADGGATWTTAPAGERAVIDITFPSATEGWAVSGTPYYWDYGGALLHTTDGGATWSRVEAALPVSLYGVRAVAFADASEGWLLGEAQYGTLLLHTIDGGAHWGAVPINDAWELRTIFFSGHKDGWIVGGGDTILATTDGGGMAPLSSSNAGMRVKWSNKTFTLRITTVDDGYGLAPTQSRAGDGPWEDLAMRTVPAPGTHANDGYHLFHYRGVDLAGNREEARVALVVVDTRPPTLDARGRAQAHHMRTGSLHLRSSDALAPVVRVRGVVFTLGGKRVRELHMTLRTDGAWHSARCACTMPVGTYRVLVRATDLAGNRAPERTIILKVLR
jgi:photosystem II stability/assembly factor-like uncharacterized protein